MWQNTEFINCTELAHIITTGISKVKKRYKSIRNSVSIGLVKMNSTNLITCYHFIALNIAPNFHKKYGQTCFNLGNCLTVRQCEHHGWPVTRQINILFCCHFHQHFAVSLSNSVDDNLLLMFKICSQCFARAPCLSRTPLEKHPWEWFWVILATITRKIDLSS